MPKRRKHRELPGRLRIFAHFELAMGMAISQASLPKSGFEREKETGGFWPQRKPRPTTSGSLLTHAGN